MNDPDRYFEANSTAAVEQLRHVNKRTNLVSIGRLIVIIGGGTALFQVVQTENVGATLIVFLGILALFMLLIRTQSKLSLKKRWYEAYKSINDNERKVKENRSWNLYDSGEHHIDDAHPYTSDLDIFGRDSLYHMLNRCATVGGRQLLAAWYKGAATKEIIDQRQLLVQEMQQDFSWWQQLQTQVLPIASSSSDHRQFLNQYLAKPIQFPALAGFAIYARIAPFIILLLALLAIWKSEFAGFAILLAIVHLFMGIFFGSTVNRISNALNKGHDTLEHLGPAIQRIEERAWTSERAIHLVQSMKRKHTLPVSQSIKHLSILLNRLDARLNIFVGSILNILFLWDIRQIAALKRWQEEESQGILEAMDALAEMECIGSFAALAFSNPTCIMPRIVESSAPVCKTHAIAHPFIANDKRVTNDYYNEHHRIALITGSNMAGKSTFLRTVGINGVLALSGAPVFADSMEISVVHFATYMRIRDSVSENTSTFKAELNRIENILKQVAVDKDTFVLLDEMLRGTNSMDKYLGSKAIIEKLIGSHAYGLIATHDLKLSELETKYPDAMENYHFDIQVQDHEMIFDYKLKKGPCTIFNASLLLKKIGIEI